MALVAYVNFCRHLSTVISFIHQCPESLPLIYKLVQQCFPFRDFSLKVLTVEATKPEVKGLESPVTLKFWSILILILILISSRIAIFTSGRLKPKMSEHIDLVDGRLCYVFTP